MEHVTVWKKNDHFCQDVVNPLNYSTLNFVISHHAKYKMNLHCESSYLVMSSFYLSTVIDGKILNKLIINYSFDITVEDINF